MISTLNACLNVNYYIYQIQGISESMLSIREIWTFVDVVFSLFRCRVVYCIVCFSGLRIAMATVGHWRNATQRSVGISHVLLVWRRLIPVKYNYLEINAN